MQWNFVSVVSDPDGHLCSTSSTSESLKHRTSCACESMESCKRGMQDDKETLASIWCKATEMCGSNSLANFLRRGRLSSICLKQGSCSLALHLVASYMSSALPSLWIPLPDYILFFNPVYDVSHTCVPFFVNVDASNSELCKPPLVQKSWNKEISCNEMKLEFYIFNGSFGVRYKNKKSWIKK